MPGRRGAATCGTYDIPFARANRSRRYQRSLVPLRARMTPNTIATAIAAMMRNGTTRNTAAAGPPVCAPPAVRAMTDPAIERNVVPNTNTMTTITTAVMTTAMPPNAGGARPS